MNRSIKYWKYTSGGMGGIKKYVKLCNALHEMETFKQQTSTLCLHCFWKLSKMCFGLDNSQ